MANRPLESLSIRTGVVRQPDVGYIIACDPAIETEQPHARIFKWHRGSFVDTSAGFNAHAICLIAQPSLALVFVSSEGFYGVHSTTSVGGNIFQDSRPAPTKPRYGSIRSVSAIDGKAYAVGLRGMVYRLDKFNLWTRIDEGLPDDFDAQAVDGFSASDLFCVGFAGQMWHFDGRQWANFDLPTNVNLTCVKCTEDGTVYAAGHGGILLAGRDGFWEVIEQADVTDDVWDLECFQGRLYVSTFGGVFLLREDGSLELVDFGSESGASTYQLSAAESVLWSIGTRDILSFDGSNWTRIV